MAERYLVDHLLTTGERPEVLSPGVVDIEGDTVDWSGPATDAPVRDGVKEHRLTGLLMPGFVNTHCHTPMILLRGAGEGLPAGVCSEQGGVEKGADRLGGREAGRRHRPSSRGGSKGVADGPPRTMSKR